MKKRYMAALTAAFITTAASPLAVHAGTVTSTGNCAKSAKVTVIGGKINDCDSIKDIMSQLGNGNWNDRWNNCTPETKPETKPEEDASEMASLVSSSKSLNLLFNSSSCTFVLDFFLKSCTIFSHPFVSLNTYGLYYCTYLLCL